MHENDMTTSGELSYQELAREIWLEEMAKEVIYEGLK